jgi:dTDP-4-amino-4,6-dideoxygalactose transaminase
MTLANDHGLFVIEDCAQAHGARVGGREVGSFGHAAAFSFCQDKIITTGGEGGLLVLDDDEAYARAWAYKDHGKSLAKSLEPRSETGSVFHWMHDSFGTNWRMTEMQAAIGRVALGELDQWLATRYLNAARLAQALEGCPGLRIPLPHGDIVHAFYRLMGRIDTTVLAPDWDRDRILRAIVAEGIPALVGSCAEIYREKAFIDAGLSPAEPLPNAYASGESSLAFLVHPTLGDADIDDTAAAIRKVMQVATGR